MANRIEGDKFIVDNRNGVELTYTLVGHLNGQPIYQDANGKKVSIRTAATGEPAIGESYDASAIEEYGSWQPLGGQASPAVSDPSRSPTDATGQPVTNNTTLPTQIGQTPTVDPATGQPQPQITPEQIQQAMQESGLTDLMQQAGLTPDQQKAIEAVYQATLANDQSYADRIAAAMQAASEYSSPYFKAQISLVADNLSRALGSMEGDLAFREQQLGSALEKLKNDIAASKEYMSFQHSQEMEDLARRYEVNLESTRQDMAATGFTQSTRRSKAEGYLADVNEGAVESSNRAFSYQTQGLDRQLQFQSAEATAQVQNLQRLAAEGKLDLLRSTEAELGSTGLQALGYSGGDVLGNIGGAIPRAQAQDALAFSNSYIF